MKQKMKLLKKNLFGVFLMSTLALIPMGILHADDTKILWGIGDNFGGATGSALLKDADVKLLSHWYNGRQDLSWIRGYKNSNTISNHYGNGYGIQLIVWLAQNRTTADYAITEQFLIDIKELTEIFKGNGPNYGPLYIVLFTELETYPPAGGGEAAEVYKQKLSQAYINAAEVIHDTYNKAQVGLGFGGYDWPEQVPSNRNIDRWEAAIAASDFTCVQQMQSYKNWQQIPGKTRNSVRQLGTYGKPVMISHFKIWSGGPDDNPDPYEKKVADAQGAFNSFMDNMFTETSLSSMYSDGLRAWVFMNDEYIRKHCDDDEVYLRAMNFVKNHNNKNPLMSRQVLPPPPIENVDVLLEYPFDDGSFNPVISNEAGFSATALTNHYLSFDIFDSPEDPHGANGGKWIQDHGQGPDHVNAISEAEAVNQNSGNQKNNYLSFTVTPESGNKLDFSWLTFDIQARTGDPDEPPALTYHAALYSSKQGWNSRIGNTISVTSNGVRHLFNVNIPFLLFCPKIVSIYHPFH